MTDSSGLTTICGRCKDTLTFQNILYHDCSIVEPNESAEGSLPENPSNVDPPSSCTGAGLAPEDIEEDVFDINDFVFRLVIAGGLTRSVTNVLLKGMRHPQFLQALQDGQVRSLD